MIKNLIKKLWNTNNTLYGRIMKGLTSLESLFTYLKKKITYMNRKHAYNIISSCKADQFLSNISLASKGALVPWYSSLVTTLVCQWNLEITFLFCNYHSLVTTNGLLTAITVTELSCPSRTKNTTQPGHNMTNFLENIHNSHRFKLHNFIKCNTKET